MIVSSEEILLYLQVSGSVLSDAAQQLLLKMQAWVERAIKSVIRSEIEQATITEYYPEIQPNNYFDADELVAGYDMIGGVVIARMRGDRALRHLQLRNVPVISLGAIYENQAAFHTAGGVWPSTTLLPANAYYLDAPDNSVSESGLVYRINGIWSTTPRTIKITYTHGRTSADIEAKMGDLKLATLITISDYLLEAMLRSKIVHAGFPMTSVTIEDFSVSFDPRHFMDRSCVLPPRAAALIRPYINLTRYVC